MIPKTIHFIWLGSPFPKKYHENVFSYIRCNPTWQIRIWTDEDMYPLCNNLDVAMGDNEILNTFKTDIMRYRIIHDHGGIYVDTDTQCMKPLDPLLERDFICGYEWGDQAGNAVIGAPAGNPVCRDMLDALSKAYEKHDFHFHNTGDVVNTLGPVLFTDIARRHGVTPFPKDYFYPGQWSDRNNIRPTPETFIVHYFDGLTPGGWTKQL
jgi:mannosyltransferase OCH1-like enzyme